MVNDPIGDLLIQIKNASTVGKQSIELPHSNLKRILANILVSEGYIAAAHTQGKEPKLRLRLLLKYRNKTSVITDVRRISKPGLRVYVSAREIPRVLGGLGTAIVSTPKGVMSGEDARKKKLGGELLCEVW